MADDICECPKCGRLHRHLSRDPHTVEASDYYVPGMWECPKCHFTLVRSFLNARDGTVSANDSLNDSNCPNDGTPMERVTWKSFAKEMERRAEELVRRVQELERTEERRLF